MKPVVSTILGTILFTHTAIADRNLFVEVEHVQLPAGVLSAVHENNEIGRDYWDSHSIHQLYAYRISAPRRASLTKIVEALIYESRRDGIDSVYDQFCKLRDIESFSECAEEAMSTNETDWSESIEKVVHGYTNNFLYRDDLRSDQKQFLEAIITIKDFKRKFIGKQYFEFIVPIDWLNVDSHLHILISRDRKRAILVGHNEGA